MASGNGSEATVEKAGRKPAPGAEAGKSGLNFTSQGTIEEEFLPALHGTQGMRVYREMADNDPTVGAIMFAIIMLCRQVKWRVDENDDAEDPEGDKEFLEGCMEDMSHSWTDHISEALSMIVFGWAWFEVVYKQRNGYQDEDSDVPSSKFDDGAIGWRKFAIRAQESLSRWVLDDSGGVKAMVQAPPPTYVDIPIPISKSLLFRTTTSKGNPEGRSLLRNAYRPWYYKEKLEQHEATGVERDLAGLPMAEVDANILRSDATPEEVNLRNQIKSVMMSIRRNKEEALLWPLVYDADGNQLYKLSLLSSGGSRVFDTNAIISRYDQRITMTVLADFILLGHEKVGSFALSSDKTDLFAVALGAILDVMAAVHNRFAVPRLFRLNGRDTRNLPTIAHEDIETPPLADVITYIQGLVSAGVPLFPDEQLENHLRKLGSLPERSDDAPDPDAQEDVEEEEPAEEEEEPVEEEEGTTGPNEDWASRYFARSQ